MLKLLALALSLPLLGIHEQASEFHGPFLDGQDEGQTEAPVRRPGETRKDAHGVQQVWVPPGRFRMGTGPEDPGVEMPSWAAKALASERPQHVVEITQGFWLDRTEVTVLDFAAFVDDAGYDRPELWSTAGRAWLAEQDTDALPRECLEDFEPDRPQVCITWYEAEAYATWRGGRLPREAEWEWAARGPESRVYPWGDTWDPKQAHVVGARGPTRVGRFPSGASWVGALDMSGNVMEWVADWLDVELYQRGDCSDPQGPRSGTRKVEKGGWWGAPPFVARSAYRHFEDPPTYQDHHIGMRVLTQP